MKCMVAAFGEERGLPPKTQHRQRLLSAESVNEERQATRPCNSATTIQIITAKIVS